MAQTAQEGIDVCLGVIRPPTALTYRRTVKTFNHGLHQL
jgi:hypothetical protein